jgi:hypothetical protein
MKSKTILEYQWPQLASFLAPEDTVEETAKSFGALKRKRSVKSALELLRLAFAWAFCGMSLRQTTAWAETANIASLSNVALLKRLRSASDWLGHLLGLKLAEKASMPAGVDGRLRIVDATGVSVPGSKGTDWRVHLCLDLATSTIDHVELTDAKGGESLRRFTLRDGDVLIADRGYAHLSGIAPIANGDGDFIVRVPWATLPMEQRNGESFDLFGFLRGLNEGAAGEAEVQIKASTKRNLPAVPVRLVAVRKTEEAAADTRRKLTKAATKKGRKTDPRTLEAAAYVIVITSLDAQTLSAEQVMNLYRFRWQIEIAFKRLKGLLDLDELPAKDSFLARTFIYTKLLGALLLDEFTQAYVSFSPWGFNLR